MKKIAVVLRGHKRTWDYAKTWTLDFFENIAEKVDYYVVLWHTPVTENLTPLYQDFSKVNLKKLEIVSTATEYYNPWLGPAYLSNIASKYIFEEECLSNVNYDMIFDTRPDVAFHRIPNTVFQPIPNAVGCDKVHPTEIDNGDGSVWQGLADQCFAMDSKTHTLWNQRFRLRKHIQDQLNLSTGNHSMLWKYSQIYNIDSYVFPWFKTDLIRPNIKNYKANTAEEFFHATNIAHNIWNNFTLEEKIQSTLDAGVCVDDYVEAFGVYHRDAMELLQSLKKAT